MYLIPSTKSFVYSGLYMSGLEAVPMHCTRRSALISAIIKSTSPDHQEQAFLQTIKNKLFSKAMDILVFEQDQDHEALSDTTLVAREHCSDVVLVSNSIPAVIQFVLLKIK